MRPARPKRVLILSSLVAASPVGGGMQAAALARAGMEPILVPTVLFGRHPGLGAPGGAAVAAEVLADVLAGVEAAGAFARLDAVITGYFADAAQVEVAAAVLDRIRAAAPSALIVVDPIMGDEVEGLYVSAAVAEAVAGKLAPGADLLTPNVWELARLTGLPVTDVDSAVAAARTLRPGVLVSSVAAGEAMAVIHCAGAQALVATHSRLLTAPKGTGDLLTALFTAQRVGGASVGEALARSVEAVAALAVGGAVPVAVASHG